MRKITCLILLTFSNYILLFAQQPIPTNTTGQSYSNTGKIKGRTYDANDKSPLPYASIAILDIATNSIITGTISDNAGFFTLKDVPLGPARLKATSMGYDSISKIVMLDLSNSELEVGNLYLKPNSKSLKSILVTSSKQQVELKADKKVINVDKDISAKGGTAIDALKNAPGISVSGDDEITLRNSTPTIYVDGKPTNLNMRQIPADQINTIEIITNPSAKYEASATGGIVNINLKKNKTLGYNGMVNVGIGTNRQYSGMGMLNIKEAKWGVNLSYNFNTGLTKAPSISNRDNLLNEKYNGGNYQQITSSFDRQMQFARVGFDYFVNNRNTISITQHIMKGKLNFDETQRNRETSKDYNVLSSSLRNNIQHINFSNYSTNLSFKHAYPKQGKEYTADITYSLNNGKNHYDYNTNNYDSSGALISNNPELQQFDIKNNANILTMQYDFTNPISQKSKIEYGFRGNWSNTYTKQAVSNYEYTSNDYTTDSLLSNKYKIDELTIAGYINYSNSIGKLSYQGGLRFESSNFKATYNDTSSYSYNYPSSLGKITYALFPSLNLSYNYNVKNRFQFNASRKIVRPNMFQSMPFIFASDKYNYRIGNPLLKPEFSNLIELNHLYTNSNLSLLTSVYGRINEQAISPYTYYTDSTNQILVNTFANVDHSYNYGVEPTFSYSYGKNISLNVSANLFYTNSGRIENNTTINKGWSWSTKSNITYKFPKQFTLQLNGNYEAPKVITLGRILAMYGADISISKPIKKFTFSASLNDIFNSRKMQIEYDQPDYYQIQSRRRDTRYVRLTMSYSFGKKEASIFKLKKASSDLVPISSTDGY